MSILRTGPVDVGGNLFSDAIAEHKGRADWIGQRNSSTLLIMPSKTIETRAHTTMDGRLNLSVDVDVADADVSVVVTVTPVATEPSVDENGWPHGFFDRVAGSMPELRRGPQGRFEERLPLE